MGLTAQQVAVCRELLAEDNALEFGGDRSTKTDRATLVRYWRDIDVTYHDACLQFLNKYTSAANVEVVRISAGDTAPSIPGVLGDYVWNFEIANGQPVRTNGTYFLKATHYDDGSGTYNWAIVDNNDFILFLTSAISGDIAPWSGDTPEWVDEFAPVSDESSSNPEFVGQTLTMDAAVDNIMVNEYGWIVTDDEATYTVTGDIVLTSVVPDEAVYGVVKSPVASNQHWDGTWSGGKNEFRRVDRSLSANGWALVQTLNVRPTGYLLVGKKTTAHMTEETRMYYGVPEADLDERVEALSALEDYAVVEVMARKTDVETIYDIYVTVVEVNDGSSYIVVGKDEDGYSTTETRKYPFVKESSVTSFINTITALGNYARVGSDARETKYDGVYHVYLTLRTVKDAANDLLIGGSGGLFKSNLYIRRRVADADLADVVTGLKSLSLIENVRSARTREYGYWDVFYTQLVVPAARVERQKSHDRRQNSWQTATYNYANAYEKYISAVNGDGSVNYDYIQYRKRVPSAFFGGDTNQWREISVVRVLSYSATDPGEFTASFSGTTSTGGYTRQLPNGIWEKAVISETIPWW